MVEKKKRKRDAKELESNLGPTVEVSEVNVKKKKMRSNVGPTCVNDAESGNKDKKKKKKKKKKNVIVDDLDVAIADKNKNEKEKKKKKRRRRKRNGGPTGDVVAKHDDDYDVVETYDNLGPTGDDVAGTGDDLGPTGDDVGKDDEFDGGPTGDDVEGEDDDDYDEPTGDNVAGADDDLGPTGNDEAETDDDYDEPTCDDMAKDDEDNRREMVSKKKKKKRRKSVVDKIVEAITAVAKAASEAALSLYIASHQKKKKKKKKKKSKLAQLQHDYSDRGREEEGKGDDEIQKGMDPSMDLGHKVQMRNADDTTLVTANNQSLPLQQPWADSPSWEANMLVKTALRAYNKKFSAQGVHEFAGGLHINAFIDKGIHCHINFHVRLVDDANPCDSDPKLIFAELVRNCSPEYQVTVLDVLGYVSQDIPPRLRGCRACDTPQHRNVLRHGDVEFNPGVDPGFWFKGKTRDEIRKTFNIRMT